MRYFVILASALLLNGTADAATSYCGRASDLAAARSRWATVRQVPVDPARKEAHCRAYGVNFYEAVTVRQAAASCNDGLDRRRDIAFIDSEIEAFNDLIATRCGS
jgi:hypothetical protein